MSRMTCAAFLQDNVFDYRLTKAETTLLVMCIPIQWCDRQQNMGDLASTPRLPAGMVAL